MSDLARLRWKCRRGLLELDLVLQRFLLMQYPSLPADEQLAFENLLEAADQDLYEWVFRQIEHPNPIVKKLQAC